MIAAVFLVSFRHEETEKKVYVVFMKKGKWRSFSHLLMSSSDFGVSLVEMKGLSILRVEQYGESDILCLESRGVQWKARELKLHSSKQTELKPIRRFYKELAAIIQVVNCLQRVEQPERQMQRFDYIALNDHNQLSNVVRLGPKETGSSCPIQVGKLIEEILVQVFRDSRGPLVHVEGRAAPAHYDHERETLVQHPAFPLFSTYSGTEGLSSIMAT
ncbi:hypothetical protein C0J52_26951 [Blattella germanica]|nr:hypothetical protein C0J52_26951 [Blattella germanica]